MAMCHKCFGKRWAVYWIEGEGWVEQPCWDCKGTGEVSCCDGPVGAGDELPSDPMRPIREAEQWPPRSKKTPVPHRRWEYRSTADRLFRQHLADAKRTVSRKAEGRDGGEHE